MGRPKKTWRATLRDNLRTLNMSWEDMEWSGVEWRENGDGLLPVTTGPLPQGWQRVFHDT